MPTPEELRHAENTGPITIIVSPVMTGLALLFVVARMVSRRLSGRKLDVGDYLVVFAIVRAPHLSPLLTETPD